MPSVPEQISLHQIRVFEMMYRYINPEISLAYPQDTEIEKVPIGTKFWYNKRNCQYECDKINTLITNL